MLRLTHASDGAEYVFTRHHFPLTIGRAAHIDLRIDDRFASRVHCEIDIAGDEIVVRDALSSHGTYLNGQPVIEKILCSGDQLHIGLTTLAVKVDSDSPASNAFSSENRGSKSPRA